MPKKNLIGKFFGRLKVLKPVGKNKDKRILWLCQCSCGKEKIVASNCLLRKNGTRSCGCLRNEKVKKAKYQNLTGKRFGRLKVIKEVKKPSHIKKKELYWLCKCECGTEIFVNTTNLKNGNTKSCGCLGFEKLNNIHYSERNIQLDIFRPILSKTISRAKGTKNHKRIFHNLSLKDLKEVWENQNGLCVYTGISLKIPEWGSKLKENMKLASVDRIDSNKGYTKDNIQFVCLMANYAKNAYSHEDMIYFCKCIKENFNE